MSRCHREQLVSIGFPKDSLKTIIMEMDRMKLLANRAFLLPHSTQELLRHCFQRPYVCPFRIPASLTSRTSHWNQTYAVLSLFLVHISLKTWERQYLVYISTESNFPSYRPRMKGFLSRQMDDGCYPTGRWHSPHHLPQLSTFRSPCWGRVCATNYS